MKNEAVDAMIEQALDTRERYARVTPADLAWTEAGAMRVTFDDEASGEFSAELLRAVCPCAECRGTHGTQPKAFNVLSSVKLKGAALQTVIEQVEPVGNYGLAITWGDGHKEGIYTWSYLRGLVAQRG
ncbi:MAG: hypothetical protein CVU56_17540 [Deltaproteobacteria bacterium HGW-Deltaproteobacteria-14]|jgi:DUF971 family protein|nr:MAG: hypothetical protein CVU56_17540 [Deltaproteobacteria bacterium HGW-Deltaproteobacteria-14]